MKRLTDKLMKDEKLAETVSVHNLTALASMEKSTIINCTWHRRYKAKDLLKYWEPLRKTCYYDSFRAVEFDRVFYRFCRVLFSRCNSADDTNGRGDQRRGPILGLDIDK